MPCRRGCRRPRCLWVFIFQECPPLFFLNLFGLFPVYFPEFSLFFSGVSLIYFRGFIGLFAAFSHMFSSFFFTGFFLIVHRLFPTKLVRRVFKQHRWCSRLATAVGKIYYVASGGVLIDQFHLQGKFLLLDREISVVAASSVVIGQLH